MVRVDVPPATSSTSTSVTPSISETSSVTAFTQWPQVSPVSPWVVVLISDLLRGTVGQGDGGRVARLGAARSRRPHPIPQGGMAGLVVPSLVHRSCTEPPASLRSMRPGGGGGPRSMATMADPSVPRRSRSDPRLRALAEESGYQVQGRIGAGGMGIVYRAHDEDGNVVAIKMLRHEIADALRARERLGREGAVQRTVLIQS